MNRIYRSIWNDKTGTFVAASEHVKGAGKRSSSGTSPASGSVRFMLKGLAASLMLAFGGQVFALPTGGVVSAGSAGIAGGTGVMTVNQASQNVAINWQGFSIGSGEAVRFVQPNSSSVALNRVLGSDPSSILGSLSANGKVFLVNPNGILFGQGAAVNVGGLVASTLNISDSDFMAGNYQFSGAGKGAVDNQGAINADGGYVALLGANVSNQGVISARLGTVALAAGQAVTLDLAGDGLLNVAVTQGAVNALVDNGGLIRADGGQVLLSAQAAADLLQSAVNNTGVIEAQTLQNHNGTIKLLGGMQSGTVNVAGRLDASAPDGGNGGFVETSAAHVKVADNAIVTTRSTQGSSGNWLIDPTDFTIATSGGDITPAALAVDLASNVTIASGSGASGTSGDINVNNDVTWSTATTLTLNAVHDVNFNANVTATGGNLVATAGNDVIVNAMAGTGITSTSGNITWTAGRDVTVNAGVVGGITATSGNILWTATRDININSAVTTTDGNFTACCGRNINISAAMTTTRGNVILNAGNGGNVVFTSPTTPKYTVTGAVGTPVAVKIYYTPGSYTTPTDYSGNFILTDATLNSYMSLYLQGNNKVYDGNTTASLSLNANPAGVSLVPGTATFDSKNVASGIGISYSGYSLTGSSLYALWAACGTVAGTGRTSAAITPAPLTVTAANISKSYGQTATPTAYTTAGLVGGDTIGSVTETSPGQPAAASVAGSPYAITPSAATGGSFVPGNYTIGYVNGALTVIPVALTVTASGVTKNYGQAPTLSAFTAAGLVNGDTIGSVTETSPGQPATASVAGSPYAITPSAATGGSFVPGNYTIGYVNGVLTVIPGVLTVTAADVTKIYGQTPTLNAFNTSGLINGDTVTGVTETSAGQPATASVAGSPYAITPSAATGNFVPANYTIAYVNGVLKVITAPLTIAAPDVTMSYGQTPVLSTFTPTGLLNGDTVGSVTGTSPGTLANASSTGGSYAITPSSATGGTFTPSNYSIGYVDGTLMVTPAIVPSETVPTVPGESPANSWMPGIVLAAPPPQLLTVAAAEVPAAPPPVVQEQAPIVVPAEAPRKPYVAPRRRRKQDLN